MDQLHGAPTDDSVLYIHWHIWTIFLGSLLIQLPSAFYEINYGSGFGYVLVTSYLNQALKIHIDWYIKSLNLHQNIKIQFVAVASPTVRMSFPPGLTWGRRNMEDPSQLKRLRV